MFVVAALVQERLKDWGAKFVDKLGKKMVELTGEFTPDVRNNCLPCLCLFTAKV
jgi:hypothetical protein